MSNMMNLLMDDEEMEIEELMRGDHFDPDDDEDDDDETMHFEVQAKRKVSESLSLTRLFKEKLAHYRCKRNDRYLPPHLRHMNGDDRDRRQLKEITAVIKHADDECIAVLNGEEEEFVLLPDGKEKAFHNGLEVYLVTESFEECNFLVFWMELAEYQKVVSAVDGLPLDEKVKTLKMSQTDADGFALWSRLGSIKREDPKSEEGRNRLIEERAKEIMKRIPLDRDDLYRGMKRAMNYYKNCNCSEKSDYAMILSCVSTFTVSMLDSADMQPISVSEIREMFPNAVIREPGSGKKDFTKSPANILIVGRQYQDVVEALKKTGHDTHLISVAGVDGNDYLFAEPMSRYGSWPGRLVTEYEEAGTLASVFVFEAVDMLGYSGRSGDPKNGLAYLLRTHKLRDRFLRDFEIDVSKTQFICQVTDVESCPKVILNEIDIIVEL